MIRILLILFFLLFSCSKKIDDLGFRTYIIPEGKHRSGNFFNHPDNSRINFKFILDESAEYTTEIPENQYDVNKIYGFSDFGKSHQKYSIRLGWRYVEGNLELCWLKRENSSMSSGFIRNIEPNEIYSAVIDINTFYYVIVVNNDTTMVRRRPDGFWGIIRRYYLYPYFGGNEFSPHDITIKIKDK